MTNQALIKYLMEEGGFSYIEATNIFYRYIRKNYHIVSPDEECGPDADKLVDFLRNKKNYPYQYLTGEACFIDLTLKVNLDVLIPRPETEDLALLVVEENKDKKNLRVLDLGTGSGAIIIYLSFHLDPSSTFTASDISVMALNVADENILEYKRNVKLIVSDYLKFAVGTDSKFDLIVSNPPYIADDEPIGEEIKYEPPIALYAYDGGLGPYKRIFEDLDAALSEDGVAYFEISSMKGLELRRLLDTQYSDLFSYRFLNDRYHRERFLVLTRKLD